MPGLRHLTANNTRKATATRQLAPWLSGLLAWLLPMGGLTLFSSLGMGVMSAQTAHTRGLCSSPLASAHARSSRFRKARRLFRKANRYAQRRAYQRAIRLFMRIVRLLRGRTARDKRGRWEAIFRIAVLNERMKKWRDARLILENLWRAAPSPKSRYRRRLRERFAALSPHVKPQLAVVVQPLQAQVILKYKGKPIPPKQRMRLKGSYRYTFDVPVGNVVLIVKKLGYQPRFQTLQMGPARAKSTSVAIERLKGIEYPAAFLRVAKKQYELRRYKKASRRLGEARQAFAPAMANSPDGPVLQLRMGVLAAKLDVIFGRSQKARRRISYLWRKHPAKHNALRRELCPLQKRYRYSPSLLPQAAKCSGQVIKTSKPTQPSGKPSIATWVLWGGAVVGIAVGLGIYFGAAEPTRARRDQDPPLPSAVRIQLHEEYNTFFALTWIAVGVGVVAGVGGTLLYFLRDRRSPTPGRQAVQLHRPSTHQPRPARKATQLKLP